MDLPDAKSPLNEMEKKVYGVNAVRHPCLGFVLENSSCGTDHEPLTPAQEARAFLKIVARENGADVARALEVKLIEWESSGGYIPSPKPDGFPLNIDRPPQPVPSGERGSSGPPTKFELEQAATAMRAVEAAQNQRDKEAAMAERGDKPVH